MAIKSGLILLFLNLVRSIKSKPLIALLFKGFLDEGWLPHDCCVTLRRLFIGLIWWFLRICPRYGLNIRIEGI
jgi:hypothetical protein